MVVSQDITERRRAEDELAHQRRLLQDVIDSLGVMVSVKDADQRFLLLNRAYETSLGIRRDDFVGKTVHDLYAPADAARFAADDAEALASGSPVAAERTVTFADGLPHTSIITRSPLRGLDGSVYGLVAVGQDITDRKATEDELRQMTEQFETAFTAAPIGMAVVALDGHWLRVNPALCELLGYDEAELAEMTFQDVTHPDDLDADLEQADQLLAGEIDHYTMEKRYFTKRGHLIWVQLSGSLVRDDRGRPLHFLAQVQDVSERRRMETQLRELAEQDTVTDLFNRRRFEEELTRQVERCRRYGEQASLMLFDVDRFKAVNDRFGHRLGDAALRTIGRILRQRLRASDVVARIGGDEFGALMVNIAPDAARDLAEEVRATVAATPVTLARETTEISISIGLCPLDSATPDDQAALAAADQALYAAKALGRDRVEVAVPDQSTG